MGFVVIVSLTGECSVCPAKNPALGRIKPGERAALLLEAESR
jgi:hypothetical protein